MADDKPIIVVKKKGGHGGHHGGAWKVAYADFVTAMMAFFMVMWLVNSASVTTRENIASYFRKPGIFTDGSGTPLQIGGAGIMTDAAPPRPDEKKSGTGTSLRPMKKKSGTESDVLDKRASPHSGFDKKAEGPGSGVGDKEYKDQPYRKEEELPPDVEATLEPQEILKAEQERVAEQIREAVASSPELQELIGIVDVKVEADGLNVEIMDTQKSSMFKVGSAMILPEAAKAFEKIANILSKLPNTIDIVGHTDAKPFPGRYNSYSNWELSSDRANAARRLLLSEGVDTSRINTVVGKADKELKKADDPLAPSNRRITLKMRFKSSKPVDLGANPDALQNLPQLEQDYQQRQATHSLTPAQILEPAPSPTQGQRSNLIKLPKDKAAERNNPPPRDSIFGDSPVIGPLDRFADF